MPATKCTVIVLCACYLFFTGLSASAQLKIQTVRPEKKTVVQYEKAEWDIQLVAPFINPYDPQDIALDMVLMPPSGKQVVLPCYLEKGGPAGSSWKARLAAREAGRYTYRFRLKKAADSVVSPVASFSAKKGKGAGFMHPNNMYTFRFDNGDFFRGLGENVGWEARSYDNPKWTYEYLLPTLSKNGANFFRTWMCPWNLPLEPGKVNSTKRYTDSDEYFNPGGIKRMEELLHMIDSLGLYVMLTLDMNSGNWGNSPYNTRNGGPAGTWKEFFSLPAAMNKYRNKLRYLVARWGYSTHIAAWEFFNEIDNGAFSKQDSIIIPHSDVTRWHTGMSRYLKETDPYDHLVTTSISHRDIAGLNSIPFIDFNQKHIYRNTHGIPASIIKYEQNFTKPYVIGEFGYEWDWNKDFKLITAGLNSDYKRGLWFGLFSPTPILPMTWWWEFFDEQQMTPYFNSVRLISDAMLQAGKGSFENIPLKAGSLHAQAVKCGDTYFVYLLNETDSSQSAPVSFPVNNGKQFMLQSYDPETRVFQPVTTFAVTGGSVQISGVELEGGKDVVLLLNAR